MLATSAPVKPQRSLLAMSAGARHASVGYRNASTRGVPSCACHVAAWATPASTDAASTQRKRIEHSNETNRVGAGQQPTASTLMCIQFMKIVEQIRSLRDLKKAKRQHVCAWHAVSHLMCSLRRALTCCPSK